MWLEEGTSAAGFAYFQRARSLADIRAGVRLIPSTHNFLAADNRGWNGTGARSRFGNIGYWSSGYSRVRQGGEDPRLPLDGAGANPLVVASGVAPDTLLRVTLAPSDFEPVIVAGASRLDEHAGLERQLVAGRALALDEERARMLRESGGSVLLELAGDSSTHRVLVSIGGTTPKPDAPDCAIECSLADLWAIQSGTANPFQLLLDGKIRIQGNASLALAVGAALG